MSEGYGLGFAAELHSPWPYGDPYYLLLRTPLTASADNGSSGQ